VKQHYEDVTFILKNIEGNLERNTPIQYGVCRV